MNRKEQQLKLQLWYHSAMCKVQYPYWMFIFWWMILTKQWFLETPEESRQYFWDNLSFNQYF